MEITGFDFSIALPRYHAAAPQFDAVRVKAVRAKTVQQ
jgi:hypothetical protein